MNAEFNNYLSQLSHPQLTQRRVNYHTQTNQGVAMPSMQNGVYPADTTGQYYESQFWMNTNATTNYGGGGAAGSMSLQGDLPWTGYNTNTNNNVFDYNLAVGTSSNPVAWPIPSYASNTPAVYPNSASTAYTFPASEIEDAPHVPPPYYHPVSTHYTARQNATTWNDPTANTTTGAAWPLPSLPPPTSSAFHPFAAKLVAAAGVTPKRRTTTYSNLARPSCHQTHGQPTYTQFQPIASSSSSQTHAQLPYAQFQPAASSSSSAPSAHPPQASGSYSPAHTVAPVPPPSTVKAGRKPQNGVISRQGAQRPHKTGGPARKPRAPRSKATPKTQAVASSGDPTSMAVPTVADASPSTVVPATAGTSASEAAGTSSAPSATSSTSKPSNTTTPSAKTKRHPLIDDALVEMTQREIDQLLPAILKKLEEEEQAKTARRPSVIPAAKASVSPATKVASPPVAVVPPSSSAPAPAPVAASPSAAAAARSPSYDFDAPWISAVTTAPESTTIPDTYPANLGEGYDHNLYMPGFSFGPTGDDLSILPHDATAATPQNAPSTSIPQYSGPSLFADLQDAINSEPTSNGTTGLSSASDKSYELDTYTLDLSIFDEPRLWTTSADTFDVPTAQSPDLLAINYQQDSYTSEVLAVPEPASIASSYEATPLADFAPSASVSTARTTPSSTTPPAEPSCSTDISNDLTSSAVILPDPTLSIPFTDPSDSFVDPNKPAPSSSPVPAATTPAYCAATPPPWDEEAFNDAHDVYAYHAIPTDTIPLPELTPVSSTPCAVEKAPEPILPEHRASSPDIQELPGPPEGFVAKATRASTAPPPVPVAAPAPAVPAKTVKRTYSDLWGKELARVQSGFIPNQAKDRPTRLPPQKVPEVAQPPAKRSKVDDSTPKRQRAPRKRGAAKSKSASGSGSAVPSTGAGPSTVANAPAGAFIFGQPQQSSTEVAANKAKTTKTSKVNQPAKPKGVTKNAISPVVASPQKPKPATRPPMIVTSTAEDASSDEDDSELDRELRECVAKLPTTRPRQRQPRKKAAGEPKVKAAPRASRAKKGKEVAKKVETAIAPVIAPQAAAPSTSTIPETTSTLPPAIDASEDVGFDYDSYSSADDSDDDE